MNQYRKKVVLGGLLIAALAIVVNAVITSRADWYLSYEIRQRLRERNQVYRGEVEAALRERRLMVAALARWVEGVPGPSAAAALNRGPFRGSFQELSLLDKGGRLVASTGGGATGEDLSRSGPFRAFKQSRYVSDQDFENRPVTDRFYVSAEVGEDRLLVGEVPTRSLGEKLGEDCYLLGAPEQGYPLLYSAAGDTIERIDLESVRRQTERPEVGYYTNHRGQRVLGANDRVTEMKWTVLTEVPEDKATEGRQRVLAANRLLIVMVCLSMIGLGLFFQRNIHSPLVELNRAVTAISEGDLSARVSIRTGDELEALGARFNVMAEGLEGLVNDLETQVKERTSSLDQANRELQSMNRMKSEFLANMSHELRTPLNSIIGFSELLGDQVVGELNQDQQQCVADIAESGQHLLGLINNILDLSKIEAGKMELHLEEVDLAELLEGVGRSLVSLTEKKQQVLRWSLEPGLPRVLVDRGKIKQVVLNLLSNAHKFTPEGGSLTLRARAAGPGAQVTVEDTGIGIAPEDQAAVFEEFRQVDGSYTREQEGTGLGLSLSRKLVELHGGRMWLESEVGKGSAFHFVLPEKAS